MVVLIVEDDFLVSLALSSMIADLGHRVAARLRSAESAFEFLERERPDIILMDIRLDGPMDGIGAAETIRERWDIPLAFLSAFGDRQTLDRAKALAPLAFLDKPVSLESLKALLGGEPRKKRP